MFTHRRHLAALAALLSVLTAFAISAPAAFAQRPPLPDNSYPPPPTAPAPAATHGSSLWLFALVALVAALITLAAVLAATKLRHTARGSTVSA